PLFDNRRMQWWSQCFAREVPRELRRDLGFQTAHFGGMDPVQLGAVADFLREQNVKDYELICWHDSPHSLYWTLGVRPPIRFMHISTAQAVGDWRPAEENWHYQRLREDLYRVLPGARFVVSDMHRI